jgi:superfamily II DNA or RNA helicase
MGHDGGTTYPWRHHQREALLAVEKAEANGARRSWVVLPPGAGKTLVGLETARRRGRPTVVLGPNTASQTQWLRGWDAYGDAKAATDREITATFTALTHQSLATFDPDRDGDGSLVHDLHLHGRALVERLVEIGDLTLVLDECHHLLEVYGWLLGEVLEQLPDAFVLGLTATPPDTMTATQAALVDKLFGETTYVASTPAVVRQGDLAPFAELAWLTTPTPQEQEWLAAQAEPFTKLTTSLSDPSFGSTSLLTWLDRRFLQPGTPWAAVESEQPELADAALRMALAGLLGMPSRARLTERHRLAPTADDWVLLIADWVEHLRGTGSDDEVVERIRRALPSVGYRLTGHGIRRCRSPVDRVLARSEARTTAVEQIVAAEHRNLGDRMRMLVLCDHEGGTATLVLEHLLKTSPELSPLLVTGTTVAGSSQTLHRLKEYVGRADLEVRDGRLEGPWTSREWLPAVTRFFEAGRSKVLVGTHGLLGDGWDARAVTGLVDLTSATTSTAVVQTRGRALRTDPRWPEKVALTWSVVCVSDEHPHGGSDWDRFVRKHDAFWGVDAEGDIVSGVAHVDAGFSPYAAPPVDTFDALNARALARSEQRQAIGGAWAVGTPYEDVLQHTIRITGARQPRRMEPPAVVLHAREIDVRDRRPAPWRPHPVLAISLVVALVAYLLNLTPAMVIFFGLATMVGIQTCIAVDRGRVLAEELAEPPGIDQVARAVADALHETGLSPRGAEAVRVVLDEQGSYRCALEGVEPAVSAAFAGSLDEVVSPMANPRYVVPRSVRVPPAGNLDGLRAALHLLRQHGVVWHSVPTVLGTNADRAQIFARVWDHWVGGGPALDTGSPDGEGVLGTHRGSDPFDVTTVLRTRWR